MTQSLLQEPIQSYEDSNGRPLNGGQLFTYSAGTLTPKATYQDQAGATPNTNPVILSERGEAIIYGSGNYRMILKNAAGATIWDRDNVSTSPTNGDLSGPGGASLVGYDDSTLNIFLQSRINRVIDSIAALRGLDKTKYTRAFVTGYYAATDGGGGPYQYDSSDTTSADNGGSIIVASDGGRWKLSLKDLVSVKQFGAKGDGSTEDTAKINAAISYINSIGGGHVYFPNGTYRVKSSIQYLPGVNLVGESMVGTTIIWWPDANTAGVILDTSNQNLNRVKFSDIRFTRHGSITANVTGILGGSTLVNYNSAIACFENLHLDQITYGIRGNAEPTGVGIFDSYFKNIWCSGCTYGLWLFGSSNRVDHPRMTTCDTGIALDFLNSESFDGMTVTGGTFVQNSYDVGIVNASGLGVRPVKFIGTWFEQSANGIINVVAAGSDVKNLDFVGCMLSTSSTVSLFNVANAVGTVTVDRCSLISGGVGKAQNFVRPTASGSRLIVRDCQKYDATGVPSLVSDYSYFEVNKNGANQSIPSTTTTLLTWPTVISDTAVGWSAANNNYVVQVPGMYRVNASIAFAPHTVSTNQNHVQMYKNGSLSRSSLGASNSSANTTVVLDCFLDCVVGDTIDIRVFHGNGSAINVLGASDLSRFSIEFVGSK